MNEGKLDVSDFFTKVFEHIVSKADHLVSAVDRRMSCEKWIHIEAFYILQGLRNSAMIESYVPEKQYPQRPERCDLYIKAKDADAWIEFETIVTNYGSSGKNITQQIGHVVEDARRLRKLADNANSWIICLAYPLASDGSNDEDWRLHLSRIMSNGQLTMSNEYRIPLTNDWIAIAYLFRTEHE